MNYLPPRPVPAGYGVRHNTPAAERAAVIAAADAARDAMHAGVPHSALGAVGTIMRARAHLAPPLADFVTGNHAPAQGAASRTPMPGKKPA